MKVQVLGAGCAKCKLLLSHVNEAVRGIGFPIEVEYITDINKIINFGIMTTPGLAIDGKVVSSGRILSKEEIVTKIMNAKLEGENEEEK